MKRCTFYIILLALWTTCLPYAYAKDGDQETTGTLSHFSSSSVTVGSLTCSINSGTEYEDSNSDQIPRSRFSVGNRVRLKCRSGVAKNLKLLLGSSSSSSSSSKSSSSSSSASSASGEDRKDKNLKEALSALNNVETTAIGSVRYKSEKKAREVRLTVSVKIPAQSTTPASGSIEQASALNLTMNLSRRGKTYARCALRYNNQSQINGQAAAEHKLDVRIERARIRNRKGTCDVNLTRAGVQKGTPFLRKGDRIIISEENAGSFLKGIL